MSRTLSTNWQPITDAMFVAPWSEDPSSLHIRPPGHPDVFIAPGGGRTFITHDLRIGDRLWKNVDVRAERFWRKGGALGWTYGEYEIARRVKRELQFEPISRAALLTGEIKINPTKKVLNHNQYCDVIAIGDFVQVSGARDTSSWRKIVVINDFDIIGLKYTQPIDDDAYCTWHKCENGIFTITEHRKSNAQHREIPCHL